MFDHIKPLFPPRRHIVGSMALDMAATTVGENPGQIIGVGAVAQWRLVVRLETAGSTAVPAPVAVALKDGAADSGPAASVQRDVVDRNGAAFTPILRTTLPDPIWDLARNEDCRKRHNSPGSERSCEILFVKSEGD